MLRQHYVQLGPKPSCGGSVAAAAPPPIAIPSKPSVPGSGTAVMLKRLKTATVRARLQSGFS